MRAKEVKKCYDVPSSGHGMPTGHTNHSSNNYPYKGQLVKHFILEGQWPLKISELRSYWKLMVAGVRE